MSYKVSASGLTSVRLNEVDAVTSVLQNVAIILSTWQGSVPMYRQFGLSRDFLDKPMPVAKPMLYAAVKEAIEEFEPRAEVVNIMFREDASAPGKLIPTVEVNVSE